MATPKDEYSEFRGEQRADGAMDCADCPAVTADAISTSPRDREGRYALILAGANDGLWDWDFRTNTVYRSARLQEILGLEAIAIEAAPEDLLQRIHPEDIDRYRASFRAYLKGDADRFQCKYRIHGANGVYRWVLDYARGQRDASGRVYRIAGSSRDITESVAADEALRDSEQRFRDYLETASDWYWETGPDHRFTMHPASARALGIQPDYLIGKRREEIAADVGSEPEKWSEFLRALENHEPFHGFVHAIQNDDGAFRYISVSGKAIFDRHGGFVGYRGSSRDVTTERMSKHALTESELRFRDIVDISSDIVWELDADFRFTFLSGAGRDRSRVPDEDIIGKTRWEFVGIDPVADPHWDRHKADLEAHRPFRNFCYTFKDRNELPRHYRVSGIPVFSENGSFAGYRGVSSDETEMVNALVRAQDAEASLRDAVDSISEGFVIYDENDCLVMCNDAYRTLYPESAARMIPGTSFEDILRSGLANGQYADAVGCEEEWLAERLRRHRSATGPVEQRLSDGRFILISERKMPNGGVAGLRMDVTALQRAQAERQESEDRLSAVADNVPGVIFRRWLKPNGRTSIVYFNEGATTLFGAGALGVVRETGELPAGLHPDDAEVFRAAMCKSAKELSLMHVEVRVITPTGAIRWLDSRSRPKQLADGTVQWDGVALDVTERKLAEAKRDHLAYFDSLTSLPNKNLFMDRLGQAVAHAARTGVGGSVVVIDFDRFREVFDSQGADACEVVLMESARRLTGALRPTDTVARIGDNQFGVLLVGIARGEDAAIPVKKLLRLFDVPFQSSGQSLHVTVSMGISLFPGDSEMPASLMRDAQTALHKAKSDGHGRYQFYAQSMTEVAIKRSSLESELHRAIDGSELEVFYQPKIRPTGAIVGMEALVRWRHPERGLIYPGEFIPIAEQSELIGALGEFVLRTACKQNKAWQEAGLPEIPVGVNLSRVQMRDPVLAERIIEILAFAGLAPKWLELEVTESAILQHIESAVALMQELRENGVRFAIDDFGVAHSALSHLIDLPVDALKVDYSFVSKMTTDSRHAAIVQAIISMAHALGYAAVAEGVETQEQAAFLRAYGCDQMQGFLYGPAVPAVDFEAMLIGEQAARKANGEAGGRVDSS